MYFLEAKKKKVRSITSAIRVNCFPYYTYDQRSHAFSDERLLCQKEKKNMKLDEVYSTIATKYRIYEPRNNNVRQLVFQKIRKNFHVSTIIKY